jgi:serine/threonine protein kinase
LLIGTPPFPFSASGNFEYIEPGDLNEVFMSPKWNETSTMAQNFVLSLLVLDERKRLTTKQALQHSWFLNEQYQSRLKQLYEEAIRDWRPRGAILPPRNENCRQSVHQGLDKTPRTALTSTLQLSKSPVIPSASEKRAIVEASREINSVKFRSPSHAPNKYERAIRDKICVSQSSTSPENFRRSFSPQAWKTTSSGRQFAFSSSKSNANRNDLDTSTLKAPKSNLVKEQSSWVYTSGKLNDRIHASTDISTVTLKGIVGAKRDFDELSQSPEIGDVYEEVENKITGKVQRVLYREK